MGPPPTDDDVHVRFVSAALAFGLVGGLTLAIVLPVQAALGRVNLSWLAHAQVHGHLQVIGFAGLFVVGMTFRLAPRFGAGHIAYPRAVVPVFWLLVAGLVLRTVGQPMADHVWLARMLALGAVLELAGATLFAVCIVTTLRPAIVAGAPHAILISAGSLWLFGQACLGAWWLGGLASDGSVVLGAARNAGLVAMQVYGFLLCTFAGVGLRVFPTFFGMPQPSHRFGRAAAALLIGGLAIWVLASVGAPRSGGLATVGAGGQAMVGAGVLALVGAFGWWRRETRFAAMSQPLSWALRATLGALTVTGVLLAATAGAALLEGRAVLVGQVDAVRHVFALGVVTLGVIGMAQLILPEFASERLIRKPSARRGAAFAGALLGAATLRGVIPLFGVGAPARFWLMSIAGVLALGSVAGFAFFFVRARRAHREYRSRVARFRDDGLPVLPG